MNKYKEMKDKHHKEVNDFPFFFAFNAKQFEEGMKKLGLDAKDTDKIYKFGNTGGFYRKTDSAMLKEMLVRHDREMAEAIAADTTGDGFIYDMFMYELANHEYCITYDFEPTLDACGLEYSEVMDNPALRAGLKKAEADYMAQSDEW